MVFEISTCFSILFIYYQLGCFFVGGVVMIGIILDIFCWNLFWDISDILWWLLVILEIIFCILGVVGEDIDFANFILLEGCLGGIGVS